MELYKQQTIHFQGGYCCATEICLYFITVQYNTKIHSFAKKTTQNHNSQLRSTVTSSLSCDNLNYYWPPSVSADLAYAGLGL